MNCYAVLDPNSVLWSRQKFVENSSKYFVAARELMELFDACEDERIIFIMRQQLLDEMLNGFPACELVDTFPELYDVNQTLYRFFANLDGRIQHFEPNNSVNFPTTPSIIQNDLHDVVKNEIFVLVTHMYYCDLDLKYFSLQSIMPGVRFLVIDGNSSCKDIPVVLNGDGVDNLLQNITLSYESSPKHEIGGWGSILEVAPEIVASLLATAVSAGDNSNALYNYYEKENTFIAYRSTDELKYHAYPVKPHEIPIKARKKLLSQTKIIIKKRKILKGKE